jgi:hypothetical protein
MYSLALSFAFFMIFWFFGGGVEGVGTNKGRYGGGKKEDDEARGRGGEKCERNKGDEGVFSFSIEVREDEHIWISANLLFPSSPFSQATLLVLHYFHSYHVGFFAYSSPSQGFHSDPFWTVAMSGGGGGVGREGKKRGETGRTQGGEGKRGRKGMRKKG